MDSIVSLDESGDRPITARCGLARSPVPCGRRLSGKTSSTIGFERRFNRAFATEERTASLRAIREAVIFRQ